MRNIDAIYEEMREAKHKQREMQRLKREQLSSLQAEVERLRNENKQLHKTLEEQS